MKNFKLKLASAMLSGCLMFSAWSLPMASIVMADEAVAEVTTTVAAEDESRQKIYAFVDRLYSVCLGREADEGGKAYWADELLGRRATGVSCAIGFIFSEEFMNKNCTNEEFVGFMYDAFFGREVAEEEIDYWVSEMDSGKSRTEVFTGFANSAEFAAICEDYDVVRGDYLPDYDINQTVQVNLFIDRMYTNVLERTCDAEGMTYWTQELLGQRLTGAGVAEGFIFSEEFINRNLCNEHYIKVLYRAFMGREYDQDGLDYWVGELSNGASREAAFNGYVASQEFTDICASYGILRGEPNAQGESNGTDGICPLCVEVEEPTTAPTAIPTAAPEVIPTAVPTVAPTAAPTAIPTTAPEVIPTAAPTVAPTVKPTAAPTVIPTATPEVIPTAVPTIVPTTAPTAIPTTVPELTPTTAPTATPTVKPTTVPTNTPTPKPTATPTPYEIGDRVTFGNYGDEDITWIILDKDEKGNYLVISEYALDSIQYNVESADVTWETCTLRSWLNEEFIDVAFTSEEQANILTTTVVAEENPYYAGEEWYDVTAGNNTKDRVFLLNIQEVERYFPTDESRLCWPTQYAIDNGCWSNITDEYEEGNDACWWWLRSPGGNQDLATDVSFAGWVYGIGDKVDYDYNGVRPALWINLES